MRNDNCEQNYVERAIPPFLPAVLIYFPVFGINLAMVIVANMARIAMARHPIPNRKNLPLRRLLIKTNKLLHINSSLEVFRNNYSAIHYQ